MTYINVKGGYELSSIAEKVVHWCINYFNINDVERINITLHRDKDLDCWGSCDEGEEEKTYDIHVYCCQPLRDFVATIVHEMVHVMQWETNKWDGDGESEAEHFQYKLTDQLWEQNTL